jgi:peroxiredoxin
LIKYLIALLIVDQICSSLSAQPANSHLSAQSSANRFVLNGRVNADTGKAYLLPAWEFSDYPDSLVFSPSAISKGKFQLSGPCSYPYMLRLAIKVGSVLQYISDYFMIGPGTQNIVCDMDSVREIPQIENVYMEELKNEYLPLFKRLDDAAHKAERMRVLGKYVEDHPASWLAFWKLVNGIKNGYDPVLDSAYQYLDPAIKRSFSGTAIEKKITIARLLAIGAVFPRLSLLDINFSHADIPELQSQTRYTLVDFWFSHCNPCISQFGELKRMYAQYHPKGFEITGISTDTKNYIGYWREVIKKYSLPWPQYLDKDGYQAYKFSIIAFPRNYLLDSGGRIVAIDIDMRELSGFLKQNIP